MLRRLTGLALAGLLLLPGTALAADPSTPVTQPAPAAHYYYLSAVEVGGKALKAEGKLWIEGGKLGVSVGCNSIGGAVTFDGRTLTVTDGLATTEMGCPGDLAAVEAALLKALAAGPFTYDGTAFVGKGVRLEAREASTGPAVPPDQVVEPVIPFDPMACKEFVTPEEWARIFGDGTASDGGPGVPGSVPGVEPGGNASSGSGSAPSAGSASGSGGGTSSSGAGTTQIAPAPALPGPTAGVKPGVSPGGSPVPVASPGAPTTVNPAPPSTGVAGPPQVDLPPLSAPVDLPLASPPVATRPVGPAPTPAIGKVAPLPGPAATPGPEICHDLFARLTAMTSGAPNSMIDKALPQATLGGSLAAGAAEDADGERDATGAARLEGPAGAGLVLVVGLLLVAWLRSLGRAATGAARG